MIYRIIYGSGFITAMCHAVGALRILAGPVTIPVSFLHKCFECRGVTLVHKQVARPLPTKHVSRRIAPGRTPVSLVTSEKIQKQTGMVESPLALLAKPENVPEEALARISLYENVLARRVLIAEPGRNSHTLHSQVHDVVQKMRHFFS